ncbi:MAG: hypothetical protein HN868_06885 [Gammaproteobacteria bacterium]|nr:hypothetical protein [Gammaproteobacteria bacterium]
MGFLTYNLKWRTQQYNDSDSSTGACSGDIEAVVKRDTPDAPAQVYCEYVAARLASLIGINVAAGVLVPHAKGLMYASLSISQVASPLAKVDMSNIDEFKQRHPVEAAGLAVFDLWVGNADRVGNVLASMGLSMDDVVAGIDNGACLLNTENNSKDSLAFLRNADQPDFHLFGSGHPKIYCDEVVERIENLSDFAIDDACVLGDTVGSVMLPEQAEVSEVLKWRRQSNRLKDLVYRVLV